MHEMSIAQSLIDIVDQEMKKHGVTKLLKVKVMHGRLANVVPEALHFAWQALTLETPFEGAELVTEEVPLKVRCKQCGITFEPEDATLLLMICPQCGEEFGHEVLSGKELYIENLEAE
ncbi:hydrogenase maturation nickel metallochaperone HypA [Desulfocurvibacter africanus]|uniref:Hydrogenase maturation factor HypA n=1 Tax=Desulfocurvibacter africanus subsp. africanus str. Walvis Bay TaxID=690850 RepID=F3Z447_DESAF|nr:hydrogenase maturation nickel metallochaperone HypA [Desulfocurvibacter africanus]EGJ51589.1 hydrogenase nickel incorporation protein hypA [Desulfocurvibacter africanus subsp. africanus str. Walvis Bay]